MILPQKTKLFKVIAPLILIENTINNYGAVKIGNGDLLQGTAFSNLLLGEPGIAALNEMNFDAFVIGNHEFDNGIEELARRLSKATFKTVCANYDFSGTVCEGLVKPYTIIERAGKRIGVFGLSPDPKGLISQENYAGVTFISPIDAANRCVAELQTKGCDAIVCLSHLGWRIKNEYNDERLAEETSGIDVIIGGHSHDYFEQPATYGNSKGGVVIMQQMGKNGRYLGYINLYF